MAHVIQGIDLLKKRIQLGKHIVILGGGLLGFELGEYLIDQGKTLSIVEQLKDVMIDTEIRNKKRLLIKMNMKGVKIFVNTRGVGISKDELSVERFGETELLRGDNVIICVGSRAEDALVRALQKKIDFTAVGDCVKPSVVLQ